MNTMASQITSVSIVCSAVGSGADQRKYQSSASLAFVREIHRWPVNSPHKAPVTRKMFPFDDVIMCTHIFSVWFLDQWSVISNTLSDYKLAYKHRAVLTKSTHTRARKHARTHTYTRGLSPQFTLNFNGGWEREAFSISKEWNVNQLNKMETAHYWHAAVCTDVIRSTFRRCAQIPMSAAGHALRPNMRVPPNPIWNCSLAWRTCEIN